MKRWVFNPALNCPHLMDDEAELWWKCVPDVWGCNMETPSTELCSCRRDKHVVAFCRTKICPTRNAAGDWDADVAEQCDRQHWHWTSLTLLAVIWECRWQWACFVRFWAISYKWHPQEICKFGFVDNFNAVPWAISTACRLCAVSATDLVRSHQV